MKIEVWLYEVNGYEELLAAVQGRSLSRAGKAWKKKRRIYILSKKGREKLEALLRELPDLEAEVIRRHFGIGRPMEDLKGIASELKLTKNRALALELSALRFLRRNLEQEVKGLADFSHLPLDSEAVDCWQRLREVESLLSKMENEFKREKSEILSQSISALDITVRTRNILLSHRIRRAWQLIQKTEDELLSLPGFGPKALYEVGMALAKWGLELGMEFSKGGEK